METENPIPTHNNQTRKPEKLRNAEREIKTHITWLETPYFLWKLDNITFVCILCILSSVKLHPFFLANREKRIPTRSFYDEIFVAFLFQLFLSYLFPLFSFFVLHQMQSKMAALHSVLKDCTTTYRMKMSSLLTLPTHLMRRFCNAFGYLRE